MLGFFVKIKNSDGKVVAKLDDDINGGIPIFRKLGDMEKEGKAKLIVDKGGYPYTYQVKAGDIMPLVEKWLDNLPAWDPRSKGIFTMMGYGVTQDLPLETTKNKTEIPVYSLDETLEIDLWDLS